MIDPGPGKGGATRARGPSRHPVVAFLSPRGRITRRTFAIRVLGPCTATAVTLSAVMDRPSVTSAAISAVIFWVFLAGFAKRIEDFGLPGLPIAVVVVSPLWLHLETGLDFPDWLATYTYALFAVGILFAGLTSSDPAGRAGEPA